MSKKRKKTKAKVQSSPNIESGVQASPVPKFLEHTLVHLAFLFFLISTVYLPALRVPWYFDDYNAILDNVSIRTWNGILHLVAIGFIHRSVVSVSYALDWAVSNHLDLFEAVANTGTPGRPSPLVFHISSLIYHFIAVCGVYLLARKANHLLVGNTACSDNAAKSESCSKLYVSIFPFVTALLFGLQPINTEAVTYLSGRASVLATIEYIYGVLALLFAAEKFGVFKDAAKPDSRHDMVSGALALTGALLLFILGIGTKEIIITMPAVASIWIGLVLFQRHSLRIALRRLMPVLACGIALLISFVLYRISVMGSIIGFEDAQVRPWSNNLLTQVGIIALYYFPRQLGVGTLCLDPDLETVYSMVNPAFLSGAVVLIAFLVIVCFAIRRAPLVSLGLVWYLISILPTSSIIPLNDLAAERRTYLPNVGFCLALCAFVIYLISSNQSLFRNLKGLRVSAVVIALLFLGFQSWKTYQHNLLYTNKEAFWLYAISNAHVKDRVYYNLGHYYLQNGEHEKAVDAFKETIARKGAYAIKAANNLAILYMQDIKDYEHAAEMFRQCIQLQPEREKYWSNLGACYILLRDFDRANALAKSWLEWNPDSYYAGQFRAQTLHSQQRLDEAEKMYLELMKKHGRRELLLKNLANIAQVKGDEASFKRYQQMLASIQKRKIYRPPENYGESQIFRLETNEN